jgi:hypothetical protein
MPLNLSAPALILNGFPLRLPELLTIRVIIPGKILLFCHCCWHNPTRGRLAATRPLRNRSGPVPRRLSYSNCRAQIMSAACDYQILPPVRSVSQGRSHRRALYVLAAAQRSPLVIEDQRTKKPTNSVFAVSK